ncbi:hypothetical protein ST37_11775 [Vibrio sp. qd031]|jgi:hypothetical protein|uniref:DUF3316 domain-containing protein n=1 Tax=Vibrio sp. qd031 TaxID=1603038 RepID=UPI000A0FE5EA|nr:DUF3316 domain-containing protein [Vibrio sp. qd031]ORT50529.1 hypothetical protein ST37_11775 [Vibrio sp. qd031]
MNKLIALSAALLVSTTAFASGQYKDVSTNQSARFITEGVSSQEEAQALASTFVDDLDSKSNIELSQQLPTPHLRMDKRSMEVTDTELSFITEEATDGSTTYRAVVDVDYTYNYRADKS